MLKHIDVTVTRAALQMSSHNPIVMHINHAKNYNDNYLGYLLAPTPNNRINLRMVLVKKVIKDMII